MKSIKEDPESDVTNGEAYKIKKGHVHHPNKGKNEPKVADVEDTIFNTEFEKKAPVKLDKLRGFMKYKRRNENTETPRQEPKIGMK